MKTVLRVALAFSWSIVPLQSWMVLLGAIFLLSGIGFGAFAQWPQNIDTYAMVGMAGAIIIAFVPATTGGAALRFASSRSMLHLRPRGRVRMLSAATLTITALAALIALPVLLGHLTTDAAGFAPSPRNPSTLKVFAVSWSIVAILWIAVFITSASRLLSFLGAFLPMIIVPPLVISSFYSAYDMPGAYTWLVPALAAWLLFAIWYMRARSFRTPRWFGDRASQNFESTPAGMISSLLDFSNGAVSSTHAVSQLLLGTPTPARYAVTTTAGVALFFVAFAFVTSAGPRNPGFGFFGILLIFGATWGAQLGYMCARRARLLWLRTGSDRASLFLMAERNGLAAALWSLLLVAISLGVFAALRTPERAGTLLLLAALQAPAWSAVFYCGMALTRGWNWMDFFLCVGGVGLLIAQMATLDPGRGMLPTVQTAAALSLLSLVLCALLRAYAKRRWLQLDWRIVRLQLPGQRTA